MTAVENMLMTRPRRLGEDAPAAYWITGAVLVVVSSRGDVAGDVWVQLKVVRDSFPEVHRDAHQ